MTHNLKRPHPRANIIVRFMPGNADTFLKSYSVGDYFTGDLRSAARWAYAVSARIRLDTLKMAVDWPLNARHKVLRMEDYDKLLGQRKSETRHVVYRTARNCPPIPNYWLGTQQKGEFNCVHRENATWFSKENAVELAERWAGANPEHRYYTGLVSSYATDKWVSPSKHWFLRAQLRNAEDPKFRTAAGTWTTDIGLAEPLTDFAAAKQRAGVVVLGSNVSVTQLVDDDLIVHYSAIDPSDELHIPVPESVTIATEDGEAGTDGRYNETVYVRTADKDTSPANPTDPTNRVADETLPTAPSGVTADLQGVTDSLKAVWESTRRFDLGTARWGDYADWVLSATSPGGEQVGDVTSNEVGSGARFNAGKVRVDLLDLQVVADFFDGQPSVDQSDVYALLALESFRQLGGREIRSLDNAIAKLVDQDPEGMLTDTARVLEHGAKKYAPGNWAKGMPWSVVFACAARHAIQQLCADYGDGDDLDDGPKGSGLPHRAHMLCNLIFLKHYAIHFPAGNDFEEAYGIMAQRGDAS